MDNLSKKFEESNWKHAYLDKYKNLLAGMVNMPNIKYEKIDITEIKNDINEIVRAYNGAKARQKGADHIKYKCRDLDDNQREYYTSFIKDNEQGDDHKPVWQSGVSDTEWTLETYVGPSINQALEYNKIIRSLKGKIVDAKEYAEKKVDKPEAITKLENDITTCETKAKELNLAESEKDALVKLLDDDMKDVLAHSTEDKAKAKKAKIATGIIIALLVLGGLGYLGYKLLMKSKKAKADANNNPFTQGGK